MQQRSGIEPRDSWKRPAVKNTTIKEDVLFPEINTTLLNIKTNMEIDTTFVVYVCGAESLKNNYIIK